MSYCRFSSLDFTCDLYVYHGVGWEVHCAEVRHNHSVENLPVESGKRLVEVMRRVQYSRVEAIRLPHAGEAFTFDTPGEAAAMIRKLVALGYRAPTGLADELEAEGEEA